MHTLEFFLGCLLLRHTDNLSKSLQKKSLLAAEGQRLARLTFEVLKSLHTKETSMPVSSDIRPILKSMTLLYQGNKGLHNVFRLAQQAAISTRAPKIDIVRYTMSRLTMWSKLLLPTLYLNLEELFLKPCKGE